MLVRNLHFKANCGRNTPYCACVQDREELSFYSSTANRAIIDDSRRGKINQSDIKCENFSKQNGYS